MIVIIVTRKWDNATTVTPDRNILILDLPDLTYDQTLFSH